MPSEQSANAGSARHLVLVVEDDELMLAVYKALFRRHKDEFACLFEKNAEDALEHLRDRKIDAAILDWDLPGITGIDLLKVIRAHPKTRKIRVMVVSGRSSRADHARAMESGADEYLAKPFQVEVLLAQLRALLRPWSPSKFPDY